MQSQSRSQLKVLTQTLNILGQQLEITSNRGVWRSRGGSRPASREEVALGMKVLELQDGLKTKPLSQHLADGMEALNTQTKSRKRTQRSSKQDN